MGELKVGGQGNVRCAVGSCFAKCAVVGLFTLSWNLQRVFLQHTESRGASPLSFEELDSKTPPLTKGSEMERETRA